MLKVKFTNSIEIEVAGDNVNEVRKIMDMMQKKILGQEIQQLQAVT